MYKMSSKIRTKTCGELSFLVDITTNEILSLKTNTLEYLILRLEQGLTKEEINKADTPFAQFIKELERQHILRGDLDEN